MAAVKLNPPVVQQNATTSNPAKSTTGDLEGKANKDDQQNSEDAAQTGQLAPNSAWKRLSVNRVLSARKGGMDSKRKVSVISKQSLIIPGKFGRSRSHDGLKRQSSQDETSRDSVSQDQTSVQDLAIANQHVLATNVVSTREGRRHGGWSYLVHNDDSLMMVAIPYLPRGVAVLCLILNMLIPGTGTMLSGMASLCCGQSRVSAKENQLAVTLCVNMVVGVAQLFTIPFMLVGWFWSLAWGLHMVSLSFDYQTQLKEQRNTELQALALTAFSSGQPQHRGLPI